MPTPITEKRLAQMLGVDEGTLNYEVEALLLQRGLIRIGPRGRIPAPWRREGVRVSSEGDTREFKPSVARRHVAALPHGASLVRDRRTAAN